MKDISGIDEPGMTAIFTLNDLRKQLPEPTLTAEPHQHR
jgi:hypothetical protein